MDAASIPDQRRIDGRSTRKKLEGGTFSASHEWIRLEETGVPSAVLVLTSRLGGGQAKRMRIESEPLGNDGPPAIDPGVEKLTAQLFHQLHRVVVEVRAPSGTAGFRKLNAIDLGGWPPQARTSEQEDELNIAIMQVAMAHVAETGDSKQFRARYMGGADATGKEVRKYVCFKLMCDEESVSRSPYEVMPAMPAGLEPWLPVLRWVMSMVEGRERRLEAREQQLMAYNERLSDKLLDSSAQAEPLLKAHGKVSEIFEQAVRMLYESALTKGAVDGAQILSMQGGDGALQEVLFAALAQFFSGGKMPPPGLAGAAGPPPPGPQTPPPPGPQTPPPPSSPEHSARAPGPVGADVRFGYEPKGPARTTSRASANTETGALVKAVQQWLGCMDGMQLLAMTDGLQDVQYRVLSILRCATRDDEVAQAVQTLKSCGGWQMLQERLGEAQHAMMAKIETLAYERTKPLAARMATHGSPAGPTQPLVKIVQAWLGSVDGQQGMDLMERLSPLQRGLVRAVRVAKTDDDAAKAVLEFKATVVGAADEVVALKALLEKADLDMLLRIDAMAQKQVMPDHAAEAAGEPSTSVAPVRVERSKASTKVEAVLCESLQEETPAQVGTLIQATKAWLGSMNGEQTTALTGKLTPEQRKCFQAVRAAQTDDQAAYAVLALKAALIRSKNWMGLMTRLGQEHLGMLVQIQTMAQQHLDSKAE